MSTDFTEHKDIAMRWQEGKLKLQIHLCSCELNSIRPGGITEDERSKPAKKTEYMNIASESSTEWIAK